MRNTAKKQLRAAAAVTACFPGIYIARAISHSVHQAQGAASTLARFVILAGSAVTGYAIALIACSLIAAAIYALSE